MRKGNWTWMPHAGHYILGDKCRFVLSTHVGGYIVSTIGELWNDEIPRRIHADIYDKAWYLENQHLKGDSFGSAYYKRFGYDEIGADRKYETMVFPAKKSIHGCCPFEMVSGEDIDFAHYNSDKEARLGHMEMCEKWSSMNDKSKTIPPLKGQIDIEEALKEETSNGK